MNNYHRPRTSRRSSIIGQIIRAFFVLLWYLLTQILRLIRWFFRSVFGQKGTVKKLVRLSLGLGLVLFIIFGLLFVYYSFNLPDPNKLANRIVPESTKIFDRNDKLLYEIHGEAKRTLVPLDLIPELAIQATIAIEDKNFYQHGGVSLTGIARAALVNLFSGSRRQGGSTITQQFVRNAVLTREKTYLRKFKEIVLALQLERKYSKDEILQLYFNEIPYGSNAYGIQAASQTFFNKDVQELTLAEAAYLAALPKAPTYYSPYGPRRDELDSRADLVLQLMYEQDYISVGQRNQAQNEPVAFRDFGIGIIAPHFVLYIQDLLAQKYGEISLQEGGLKVTTTLDLELQQIAEEAIANQIERNETNYNAGNAALLAIDPKTGQALAMVGSRDYFDEEHDGAVNVTIRPRQPGSSFKPYVYATAFKQGMNPATLLLDVVTNFGEFGGEEYAPQNYDGGERGPVSIRQALAGSLNIPAVKTTILVGVENAIDMAEAMGITTLKQRSRYGPSLVLGGGEVKLLEHVSAFGVFANGGIRHEPVVILKTEDKTGRVLEEYQERAGREVLDPQIAYQINHILSDNNARASAFGVNNHLTLGGRPVAAKTGTTQEFRDAWTVGYTPQLAAGVWVGNNDNSAMRRGAAGAVVAAPIWNKFMRDALADEPVIDFSRPEGIREIAVDALSGKLPTAYTPQTKTEVFAKFNVPSETDDVHIPVGNTVFTVLRSERREDPAWEEPVRAWAIKNGYSYPDGADNPEPLDRTVSIEVQSPEVVSGLPWQVKARAAPQSQIEELELFLDGQLLSSASGATIELTSSLPHVDGRHQILIQARTRENKISRQTAGIEFRLGRSVALINPAENQTLTFPTNLMLESNQNIAAENAVFLIRDTAGAESRLAGTISKQQLGSIFHYTLNWSSANQPPPGSYVVYGQIGGQNSQEVVIKVP